MSCPNTEFVAFADIYTRKLEEAKRVAPNAKTYLNYKDLLENKSDRRGPDRHAATSALRALRRRSRRGQACLSGKDDGVHRRSRQEDARRLQARRQNAQCRSAINPAPWARWPIRCSSFPQGLDGQGHGDSRTHVPQYAAWQTTVVAPRLSGHDARKHYLEGISGRRAAT